MGDLSNRVIYFDGSQTDWNRLNKTEISPIVYTYVACIHNENDFVFTYDDNGRITTDVADMTVEVIAAPTCKDPGVSKITCNRCKAVENGALPKTNDHIFEADLCTVCKAARRIVISAENFGNCDFIKNDPAYPFAIDGAGVITSQNHLNSSVASMQIVATATMTVNFRYKVDSESNFDYFRIYLNGMEQVLISGNTAYETYSIILNAEDRLSFEYQKDGSSSSGKDCAYVKDLVIIMAEPAES